ncbi:NAD(+)/NADH kinase [Natrinema versiforme]|uniref:ATP-NAD/AcoX kinase n=1 Tax=Natrinema versiforme JCM 10478 TaxID=1227496 RepID=L9Y999_9EURY|nr:NAD(+)/NADH kinase [Natrinema versiforme]ELY70282.1 ATP-NAD/AcoX kinase [Natrinema versiforme JCM 10478]
MDAAWSAGESPVVGVVGEADTSDAVEIDADLESVFAASDADVTAVDGGLEDVLAAEPSMVVAAGEATLSAVARADSDVPVLPVGPVSGIESVDRDHLPDALAAVLDGRALCRERAVLGVSLESAGNDKTETATRVRALFDVTLITDEPARISEYGVRDRGTSVATFRADGVVAATPAGSHGYASAVDAPHLSRAVDAVAVAPIGPFVTQTRRWVLPTDELTFTVEREACDVALVVDGRSIGSVTVDSRVTVSPAASLSTLVVPDERLAASE